MTQDARDVTALVEHLHQQVRNNGVSLAVKRRLGPSIDAVYHSPEEGGPRITIFRNDPDVPDDAWREIALVAHEFGHHMSFRQRWRTPAYLAAARRFACGGVLGDDDAIRVLREECIAWRFGAWLLCWMDMGFPDYARFKRENLLAYCNVMMLGESWAGLADEIAATVIPDPEGRKMDEDAPLRLR